MTLSLTLGWWIVPVVITLVSYLVAYLATPSRTNSYDWYGFGTLFDGIIILFGLLAATIVSLVAWLVWALL